MSKVVVVGSLNNDLTLAVDHLPAPGETVLASSPTHVGFGGKGGNQASAAAALGGEVAMVGRVGDDGAGEAMRADLAGRGIDTSSVRVTPGARTGTALITVDRTGDNTIVVDPGANGLLSPSDVGCPAVVSAAVVLLQLEIPMPAVAETVRVAGGSIVLNPAPARTLDNEILSSIDVLVPNRTELGLLTRGVPPGNTAAAARLAAALPYDFDVVVTLGADGALVLQRRRGRTVALSAPEVEAVDATGAGDTFCGALAVALAQNEDLDDAAALAVASASISTTGRGARGVLPSRQEAEDLAGSVRRQLVSA